MTSSKKLFSTNGEAMLNARKTAKLLDCAPDYVSRLCREGKLEGVRHQGQWYVDRASVARFEAEREAARAERAQVLATERRQETRAYAYANKSPLGRALDQVLSRVPSLSLPKHAAAALLISILLGGTVCASSAALSSTYAAPSELSASAGRIDSPFFSASLFSLGGIWHAIAALFAPNRDVAVAPAAQVDEKPAQLPSVPTTPAPVSVATTTQTFVTNTYPVVERTVERTVAAAPADLSRFVTYDVLSAQIDSVYRSMSRHSGGGGLADFSGLTAADIPALSYLPLAGGTLTGALTLPSLTTSATSTLAGITLNADCSVYNNGGKLTTDALGNVVCDNDSSSSGSGAPGGNNTYVQFNDAGSFGGDAGFTYNKAADRLTVSYASTTAITATTASTTNLVISGVSNALLKTVNGVVTAAIAGTDYQAAGNYATFAYPFPSNATSTNITFGGGITGTLTGNASTATALQTGRTINGVTFDGTANITITAASSTLLANSNTFSGTNTFTTAINGSITGNAGTVTNGVYTTTFGGLFAGQLAGTTTNALAEGGNNLYYTNARATANFVSNLAATTSVASITTLPNLSLPYGQLTGTPSIAGYPFPSNATTTSIAFNGGLTASNATIAYASTTAISGATAQFTTSSSTNLVISGITNGSTQCLQINSSGTVSGTGSACGSGGSGITQIGPAGQMQSGASITFATSTSGSDFTVSASADTITFNLPIASASNTGKLTATDWNIFNNKISSSSLDTSAKLASLIGDEVGTGALVFGTNATLSSTTLSGSTLLANATTTSLGITGISGSLLKTTAGGSVVAAIAGTDYQAAGNYATFAYPFPSNATSTNITFSGGITGALTGNASTATALQTGRTINGVTFDGTANITITAASSTLLANSNTFSGTNTFTTAINGSITGNAGTVTNGVYTTTFNALFDPRFITDLAATTSIASITTLPNLSLPSSQVTGLFAYPFPSNATSTLIAFNGGLTAYASSTISNLTTVNATTTNLVLDTLISGSTGTTTIAGNLIPAADNTYSLGAANRTWKHVFIGPGSLYVNGQEVISTNGSNDVVVSSDPNQNLVVQTSGTSNIELNPMGGSINFKNTVNVSAGKSITTTDLSALPVPNGVKAGNITVSNNTVSSANTNGDIAFSPNGNGDSYFTNGNVGIGTTNPGSKLEVQGVASAQRFVATSSVASVFPYASSTALSVSGALYTPLLSSLLKADAAGKLVAASAGTDYIANTSGDWTGTFDGQNGSYYLNAANLGNFGTPFYNFFSATTTTALAEGSNLYYTDERVDDRVSALLQAGSGVNLIYNDGANTLTISSTGGGGGGTDVNWTYFNGSAIRPATSTNQVLIGGASTSTLVSPFAKLGVFGGASIDYASTTGITADYASTTNLVISGIQSSLLKTVNGVVTAAVAGTDYLTSASLFAYPFPSNATTTQLAFNGGATFAGATTTALAVTGSTTVSSVLNVGGAINANGGITASGASTIASTTLTGNTLLANATSSSLYAQTLGLNAEYFTDLTGAGLQNVGGALTLNTAGDWTGTFDGQNGSYYLANSFSTTSAAYFSSLGLAFSTTSSDYWLTQKSTSNIAEGSNLYFTNARADARVAAGTTTIRGMVSATAPLSYSSATGDFSILQASGSQNGYLSSGDFTTFNNKISSTSLSAGAGISYNSSTGVIANTIGYPFPGNATSTQIAFNGGLSASTLTVSTSASLASTTLSGSTLLANATTTSLGITGISSALLKTTANGSVVAAIAGTDYVVSSQLFAYPFPSNATSTNIAFNGGLTASTITATAATSTTLFGGRVTGNTAAFGSTATSSFSSTGALTLATALTVANGGTGSTTLGGILTGNGTGIVTSASITGPLTFSGNTLSIAQATGSQNGYLSSGDFTTFNNKISSTSLSAGAGISYNSSTGVIANTIGYPFPGNATTTSIAFNGGLSGSLTGNASTATALQTGRTINGVTFDGTANIVVAAASSTLLANSNTFSGTNTFTTAINGSITGNAGTVTNGVYTTTFNALFDPRFITDLAATTSIASITTLPNLSLPSSQVTGLFAYPFPSNATSTQLAFNGGLTASTISATAATTTSLGITGISGALLKTTAGGSVVAAIAGTDYLTSATIYQYPFPGNATSTLIAFNGGITANASTLASTTLTGNTLLANATTTSLGITSLTSSLLKTNAQGTVVAASAGSDFESPLTFSTGLNRIGNVVTNTGVLSATGTLNQINVNANTGNVTFSLPTLVSLTNLTVTAATTTNSFTSGTLSASTARFGGAATTTIDAAGNLAVAGTFTGASLAACSGTADKLLWNAGVFSCGVDAGSSGGTGEINWTYFNTSAIRVSTSTNQVLIGASSTTTLAKLEVVGGLFTDNATSSASLFGGRVTGNSAAFGKSASTTIDSAGNVGIGSTTPSAHLAVVGGNILQTASGNPKLAATSAIGGNTYATAVSGHYAYVANLHGGLRIMDVTNPAAPALVGSLAYNGGSSAAVSIAVAGRYAYVGDTAVGLVIIDVSNPQVPAVVSTSAIVSTPWNMALSGKYLYVADGNGKALKVVDVSNPAAPVVAGSYSPGGASSPQSIAIAGKYAYMGDVSDGKIYIVDISNPTAPSLSASYASGSVPVGLYVSGKYLYVADVGGLGFYSLDVSKPSVTPTLVGSYAGAYYGVAVAGQYAYIADNTGNAVVLDLKNQASPALVGSIATGGAPLSITVVGKYAYVSADAGGIAVIDINGATLPAANIASLQADTANIADTLTVGGNIYAGGGLDVGISGIYSRGTIAAYIASSTELNPVVATFMGGNVGVGTSSPFAKLSVAGNIFASGNITGGNITATGTLAALNILATGSTTLQNFTGINATTTNATTTSFAISNVTSSLLKTLSNGAVVAAVAGTDYLTSATTFAYPFPSNATTTNIAFNGGLTASTITATAATSTSIFGGRVTGNTAAFGSTGSTTVAADGALAAPSLSLATALTVANGGTGSTTLGGILTGNGTGVVTAAAISGPLTFSGNTLSIAQATGGSNGYLSSGDFTTFNNKISSTSLSSANGYLSYNSSTGVFTASTSPTYAAATSTAFSTTNLTIGSLTGLLKASSGAVTAAVAGTDYESPLTFGYPLQRSVNAISLAFGTSTSNTWGGTQTFTAAPVLGALTGLVGANNGTLYQISTSTSFVTSLAAGAGISLSGTTGAITVTNTIAYPFPSNATTTQIAFNGGATFAGATTTALAVTGSTTVSSILNVGGAINANGGVVGNVTGALTGNASTATALQTGRTINGVTFDGTANITITAASSTLLANSNTFSGTNTFSNPIVGSVTGNAGTVTNGVYTTTFNALFDPRFITDLAATTSIASITTLPNLSLPSSQVTGLFAYPFPSNATTTLIAFSGGLTASTISATAATSTSIFGGRVTGNTAAFGSTATSSFSSTGALTLATALTVANGGTGSTTLGGLLSGNGASIYSSATGTVAASNGITVTGGQAIIGSGLTITGTNAAADGATHGVASFAANDFDAASGNISIDYTNGQKAGASQPGFLTAADWSVFSNKISSSSLSAVYPLAYNSSTGVFTTAFSTTTANTYSALNTFNGGVAANTLTVSTSASLASTTLSGNSLLANATTTKFAITGISGSLLKTTANGSVVAAVAGTDYLTSATTFAYPFPSNATTTQIAFNGGATFAGATSTALAVTGSTTISSILNVGGAIKANGGVVGNVTGALTGNADTATKLATPRTIAGVSFDGSSNISLNNNAITNGAGYITSLAGAASSTLLADSNTFSGTNTFSNTISGSITGNAGTVTNGVYTTTFNSLFDPRFITDLAATTSIASITTLPNLSILSSQVSNLASTISAAYPFQGAGNSTSTLTQFNGGLTAYASSTIGNGTATGGLTIWGNGTTTGTFEASKLLVNTATPYSTNVITTQGGVKVGGALSIGSSAPAANLSIFTITDSTGNLNYTTSGSGSQQHITFNQVGNFGIGTTSPFTNFAVQGNGYFSGNVTAANITATGTLAVSGNTMLAQATSTSFAITGVTSSLLKTLSNGAVVAAIAGTDYQAAGNYATFAYPFPSNATTTSIAFNGGLSGSLTGNASTATALQTGRTINGVTFDGTANITITAASSTLLANSNTFSGTNTFSNPIVGSVTGNAGTVTNGVYTTTFNALFDTRLSATTTLPNITTLANLSILSSQVSDLASTIGAAYPFQGTGNSTSTLTQFNGGFTAYASSTIGNGTQAGGLTVNGGATTTGNAYIAGSVGVGTSNTSVAKLAVNAAVTPIGSELVTNGTFTGSATGWTLQSGCSVYGSNQVTVLYDAGCQAGANWPKLDTSVSLTAGHTYVLTFDVTTNGDQPYAYFTNNSYSSAPFNSGSQTVYFTASYTGADTLTFESYNYNNNAGWSLDNVSLREVPAVAPAFVAYDYSGATTTVLGDFNNNTSIGHNALFAVTSTDNTGIGYNAGYNATSTAYANFFGNNAGYGATSANGSNFFGHNAGYTATSSYNSNFFGNSAGYSAANAPYSNFLGNSAGYGAAGATYSNFIGSAAGIGATGANNSNFFGQYAGYNATSTAYANFFGNSAGYGAANATYSNFLGNSAGNGAGGATNSNFLGRLAGKDATGATYSNFLGDNAGYNATSTSYANFIGASAGYGAAGAINSNFLGQNAGYSAKAASNSNFFGPFAGWGATNAAYSNFFGTNAGQSATNAANSIFIGFNAGVSDTVNNTLNGTSIAIGQRSGTGGFSDSIALGHAVINSSAQQVNIGNVLYATGIYNSDTQSSAATAAGKFGIGSSSPFAKLSVHANNGDANPILFAIGSSTASATTTLFSVSNTGSTTIANGVNITAGCYAVGGACLSAASLGASTFAYPFPSNATTTQIAFNGGLTASSTSRFENLSVNGTLDFATTSTSTLITMNQQPFLRSDGLNQVGLGVGALSNASYGLWDVAIGRNALSQDTSGDNTAVGNYALSANTTGSNNAAFGEGALQVNTAGSANTAVGSYALGSNISGSNNTSLGNNSMSQNTTGAKNVALGQGALYYNQTGVSNIAIGYRSAESAMGDYNIGIGEQTFLSAGASTSRNVAIGAFTGSNLAPGTTDNVMIGHSAGWSLWHAYGTIVIGSDPNQNLTLSDGGNNILLGNGNLAPSATASNFLNVGGLLFGTLPATTTAFKLPTSGALGVGTSSPFAKLSVALNNGDTAGAAFAIGSSTASATTTLFSVDNAGNAYIAGNVGVGTANPVGTFDIDTTHAPGVGGIALIARDSVTANSNPFIYSYKTGGASGAVANLGLNVYFNSSGTGGQRINSTKNGWAFNFDTRSVNDAQLDLQQVSSSGVLSTFATFGTNGNVGIGSTTPGSLLSVGTANGINFSTATSTFSSTGGINLAAGCFAINGACLSSAGPTFSYPFTSTTNFGVNTSATTTPLFAINGLFASSTSRFESLSVNGTLNFATTSTSTLATFAGQTFLTASAAGFNTGLGIGANQNSTIGVRNASLGYQALLNATSTSDNIAIGYQAVAGDATNFSGTKNIGIGTQALFSVTSGGSNTAIGYQGLALNTTGSSNAAFGSSALFNSTSGSNNAAFGKQALFGSQTGSYNTALGVISMALNTTGSNNTAAGYQSLYSSVTGSQNTAFGYSSSGQNISATSTVAVGYNAAIGGGSYASQGYTAVGFSAGAAFATGSDYNSLFGYQSGSSITSGARNILIGASETASNLTTGYENIGIGNNIFFPTAAARQTLNIGNLLYGSLPATTTAFQLPTSGALGVGTSSPFAKLSIALNNGDTAGAAFAIGSSTASATTTLFSVDNTGSTTIANGVNITAGCFAINGTCLSTVGGSASSTLLADFNTFTNVQRFNGGLTAYASTTIGNGTATGGLTVSGNATTTGTLTLGKTANFIGGLSTSTLILVNGQVFITASSTRSNTSIGLNSLAKNTTGAFNTASGYNALAANVTGSGNTAIGWQALLSNTIGTDNTAIGEQTLFSNTSGYSNIAMGTNALYTNTAGYNNIALGMSALFSNTTGVNNTVLGYSAGSSITTGYSNTIVGDNTQFNGGITTGDGNVGLGSNIFFQSATANSQLNIGNILYGSLPATTTAFQLPTSGSIGVGTSSPFAKLSIALNNGDTEGTAFAIGSSTASATTTLFSVSNTGNVGIGTAVPGTNLDVIGSGVSVTANITSTNAGGQAELQVRNNGAASTNALRLGALGSSYTTSGAFVQNGAFVDADTSLSGGLSIMARAATGVLRFYTGGSAAANESMRITSAGSIGVGTTSPFAQFALHAANGSTNTTLFAIGSSTASATTTLFSVSNTGSIKTSITGSTQCLHVDSTGTITGTGSDCSAGGGGTFPFTPTTAFGSAANATSTLIGFTNGLYSTASSTFNGAFTFGGGAINYAANSTSTVPNNTPYAWTIATSSTAKPLFAINTTSGSEQVSIGAAGADVYIGDTGSSPNLVFQNSATIKTASGGTLTIGAGSDIVNFGVKANFGSGLTAFASSTIGDGTATGGLTISGGATTTGNAYFGGNVGIGTTTPGSLLSVGNTTGINFTTATSTFSTTGGINIKNGCYAVNGTCLSAGGGGASLGVANTWTALQTFQAGLISQASTTIGNGTQAGGLTISGGATSTLSLNILSSDGLLINGVTAVAGSTARNNYYFAGATTSAQNLGSFNYAIGKYAMGNATSSSFQNNFAVGYQALLGSATLQNTGTYNNAIGAGALFSNVSGSSNNAFGNNALYGNVSGSNNNAFGSATLNGNTTGYSNNAIGNSALNSNSTGHNNNAIGGNALLSNSTGSNNNGIGTNALFSNSTGSNNIGIGMQAGRNISTGYSNIVIGDDSTASAGPTTGFGNLSIGSNIFSADPTANSQLNIGNFLFGTLPATTTAFKLPTSGSFGVGSSSPFAKFSIHTNNGDTENMLFAIGSSTASATTTLFSVDNTGLTTVGNSSGTGDANFQFAGDANAWSVGYKSSDKSFNIASSTDFSGTAALSIAKNGNATFTGSGGTCTINGSGACTSDIRLKTNIASTTGQDALDRLAKLDAITYNWADPKLDQSQRLGVVAQEVQKVFPQLVGSTTVNFKGTPGTYLTVDYGGLAAPLIAAVNELNLRTGFLATSTPTSTPAALASGPFAGASDWLKSALVSGLNALQGIAQQGVRQLGAAVYAAVGTFDQVISQTITADTVNAKKLCLEDVCIDKTQLQNLLNQQPAGSGSVSTGGSVPPPAPANTSTSPAPAATTSPEAAPAPASVASTSPDVAPAPAPAPVAAAPAPADTSTAPAPASAPASDPAPASGGGSGTI